MYFKNKLKLLSLSLSLVVFGLLSACGDTATVANPVSTTVASAVVTTAAVSTTSMQVSNTVASAVVTTAAVSTSGTQVSTVAGAVVTYGSGRGATIIAGLPTPLATRVSGGTQVSESDIPVYPGARRVDSMSASVSGMTSVFYLTSDDYSKVVTWVKKAFTDKGWTEVGVLDSLTQVGSAAFTGKRGTASFFGTIVGPNAQKEAAFAGVKEQTGAGSNDTILSVSLTSG